MSARGFSLLELLLASALLIAVTGALAAMTSPMREMFERALLAADLDGGRRAALQLLSAELREAGSDAAVADPAAPFARVHDGVVPLRDLDGAVVAIPAGAVRVVRVPHLAAASVLDAAVAAGDTSVPLATAARCRGGPPVCGFRVGMAAVLYDATAAADVTIAAVGPGVVRVSPPLPAAFAAGAVLAEMATTSYGLRPNADGSRRLVRRTAGGAEQPVLDNVVEFSVRPDTHDLRRIRRVEVLLRLEAPDAWRGPAGELFRRAGTASHARRWLPDVELRTVVTLRNAWGAS